MRKLKKRELAVQIWNRDFPEGRIELQVDRIKSAIVASDLGQITEKYSRTDDHTIDVILGSLTLK